MDYTLGLTLQGKTRVIIALWKAFAEGVVQGPDNSEGTEQKPSQSSVAQPECQTSALCAQPLVDQGEGWVSSGKGKGRRCSCYRGKLLIGGADNRRLVRCRSMEMWGL